jgi:hypothetical protein
VPRRPEPPPLQTNDRVALLVGIGAWLIALAVLGGLHATLARHRELWWLSMCGAGVVMGVYGLWLVRKR